MRLHIAFRCSSYQYGHFGYNHALNIINCSLWQSFIFSRNATKDRTKYFIIWVFTFPIHCRIYPQACQSFTYDCIFILTYIFLTICGVILYPAFILLLIASTSRWSFESSLNSSCVILSLRNTSTFYLILSLLSPAS